jgi:hypothetical protein
VVAQVFSSDSREENIVLSALIYDRHCFKKSEQSSAVIFIGFVHL